MSMYAKNLDDAKIICFLIKGEKLFGKIQKNMGWDKKNYKKISIVVQCLAILVTNIWSLKKILQ